MIARKTFRALFAAVGLCCATAAVAQTTTTVILDLCRGKAEVRSQQQQGHQVALEVEVSVADCEGVCTGSLEYSLRLTDADNRESIVHLTENWRWREVQAPFTLNLAPQVSPGFTLQEVVSMQIGRCSCSTGQITSQL
jgi:hypothetical protein